MRILMLNDRISARGGAERHLWGVLERLQNRAETLLAVGHDDLSLPQGERGAIGRWQRVKGLGNSGFSARGQGGLIKRLDAVRKQFRPDLVHVHNIVDPAVLDWVSARGPSVMTVQDHRMFCPGMGKVTPGGNSCGLVMGANCLGCFHDRAYGEKALAVTGRRLKAAANLSRITVLSEYMARELAGAWYCAGLEPPPVAVIPPFVHGIRLGSKAGPGRYHLLACRLVERKGVLVALKAALEHDAGLPLVVAGDGVLAQEVADKARSGGGRVVFKGWAGRAEMCGLLAGARSLWLPSLWAEPFGIIGLEAMSMGVPVIASPVGGAPQWLGREGVRVEPGDAAALARTALKLAQNPELAEEMGKKGRLRVLREFDPIGLMDRLWGVYRAVAGDY